MASLIQILRNDSGLVTKMVGISSSSGDIADDTILFFTDSSCAGTPYVEPRGAYSIIKHGSNYYTGDYALTPMDWTDVLE